ncbi:cache domain-containing protein, partial [Paenibacillus sp. MCAF20]
MLQLAFLLFCVMAIPMVILTWYSGAQILRNSEQAIAESSLSGLNASRMLNENALTNLSLNTVRLASSGIFDRIRPIETYAKLNASYQKVSDANAVLDELLVLNQSIDGIYSSFFYLNGSDYVVSSDKGITTLEKYEPIDWLDDALQERIGIRGVWYPRRNASGVPVISFVFPLNSLSTATSGTIVINLKESQIEQYLQATRSGKQDYLLISESGIIISHADKSLLLNNGSEDPFLREIIEQSSSDGFAIHELDNNRLLYAWSRSKEFGWINVSTYSVDELMKETHILQKKIILFDLAIIFVGSILAVLLATWLSKPIRKLVRTVRE